ncbi:ExeA family protein [Undibacterium arcticum]
MSERHREALAHLLYGVDSGGGFVLLTGEIGAGKTTVCRCFLQQIPSNCNVAYIFNPKLTETELLQSVCDEFRIGLPSSAGSVGGAPDSAKIYVDALNRYLLEAHARGENNVLIIDEAQNLSAGVLEQLRLLTNLETNDSKLLQIILIGQPELRSMLARPELEQLAQRVIARYHLDSLSPEETTRYVQHRLSIGGLTSALPFDKRALPEIHRQTNGVPRRINVLCDRALLGGYAENKHVIDRRIVRKAAAEVFGNTAAPRPAAMLNWPTVGTATLAATTIAAIAIAAAAGWAMNQRVPSQRPSVAAKAPSGAISAIGKPSTVAAAASGAAVTQTTSPDAASNPARASPVRCRSSSRTGTRSIRSAATKPAPTASWHSCGR